jgi:hypothetical protein
MPTKRSKIRSVAKASRRNGDEFSIIVQKHHDESKKGRVEVARFYLDTAEESARAGFTAKLLVRGIEDCQIKDERLGGKEASVEGVDSRLDEIPCSDLPFAGYASLGARSLARR